MVWMETKNRITFMNNLSCREILSTSDPAWQGWKEIYYASFPISERMSDDFFILMLDDKSNGHARNRHMLALTGRDLEDVKGMAFYETHEEINAGILWYIAIAEKARNRGMGTYLYQQIAAQAKEDKVDFLVLEVEISEAAGDLADRRLAWYRRQGAKLLEGVEYYQEVDTGQPPLPMLLMAHPFVEITAEEAYTRMKPLFEDKLNQTGPLSFT
jgi:ribosomal protein S18 acetylase RimI-like enzyme